MGIVCGAFQTNRQIKPFPDMVVLGSIGANVQITANCLQSCQNRVTSELQKLELLEITTAER